jgi:beta-galactosidase
MKRRNFLSMGSFGALGALSPILPALARVLGDGAAGKFSFSADGSQFLMNETPFQIRSGEMHPARIPVQYWQHRIRMAKAMGMNTIAVYLIWNYHEVNEGEFDFHSENRDIAAFIRLCQREGMWVLMRPGPYVCAEWDLGGIPSYLLRHPDVRLRAHSGVAPQYMAAVSRYIARVASFIKPLMINSGGPILMLQIENEFGSFGSDAQYLEELRQLWIANGVGGPFYTEDSLGQLLKNKSNVVGGAIALSGGQAADIKQARAKYPAVPAMSGELYPGWLTHWGEAKFQGRDVNLSDALHELMKNNFSFNMYVIHGGTNFGFTAGANDDNDNYMPDVTSYDYAAPISEQGMPTQAYYLYRKVIGDMLKVNLPDIPAPIPTVKLDGGADLMPQPFASVWDNLPNPIASEHAQSFESLGRRSGFILYRKQMRGFISGELRAPELNDYGTVFLDQRYVGGFTRTRMPAAKSVPLKLASRKGALHIAALRENPSLDILVEAMGRNNFGTNLVDRKGILKPVSLKQNNAKALELVDWQMFQLPMDKQFIEQLKGATSIDKRPGLFFKLAVTLEQAADTYIDMQRWTKGVVWVNGNNLGRYWNLGPQQRLYCPAPWLKAGANEIVIFDLHQIRPETIALERTLV